jgi:hypothetical protein
MSDEAARIVQQKCEADFYHALEFAVNMYPQWRTVAAVARL